MQTERSRMLDKLLAEAECLNRWSAPRFGFKLKRRLDWLLEDGCGQVADDLRQEVEQIAELWILNAEGNRRMLDREDRLRRQLCAAISALAEALTRVPESQE